MIQIAAIKRAKLNHCVVVVKGDAPLLKGHQPLLAQFAQHPVDVNRA